MSTTFGFDILGVASHGGCANIRWNIKYEQVLYSRFAKHFAFVNSAGLQKCCKNVRVVSSKKAFNLGPWVWRNILQ